MLGKVNVEYLLFLNINLIIKYLTEKHIDIFIRRLDEITDYENAFIYCLKCFLNRKHIPSVIYCLRKLKHFLEDKRMYVLKHYIENILINI